MFCEILDGKHCSSVLCYECLKLSPPATLFAPCSLVKYPEFKALEASEQLRRIQKLETNPAGSDNKAHRLAVKGEH
jgi:hypothetical protein